MKFFLLALLLIQSLVGLANSDGQVDSKLPDLWPSVGGQSYHIRYRLGLINSSEILQLEEWASFDDQLFRLTVNSAGRRTSYLTYGRTGEVFRYRPFSCQLIDDKADDYQALAGLFLGYPINGLPVNSKQAVLAYGLGPLWLRARQQASRVTFLEHDPLQPIQVDGSIPLPGAYDLYWARVPGPGDLSLKFLFPVGKDQFVDILDWLSEREDAFGAPKLQAKAKLMEVVRKPVDQSVFELPLGYGCPRRQDFQEDPQREEAAVSLLEHSSFPFQTTLAVTSSRPNEDIVSASSSWSSHSYTINLLQHRMRRQIGDESQWDTYYASLVQERNEQTGRLQRTKRVWWRPSALAGGDSRAPEPGLQSVVYELDLTTGGPSADQDSNGCKLSYHNVSDQLMLAFPGAQRLEGAREAAELQGQAGRMQLSLDRVLLLISDGADFQLIRRANQTDDDYEDLYFEKRLHELNLTSDGSLVWSGPVSVVKQISGLKSHHLHRRSRRNQSKDSNQVVEEHFEDQDEAEQAELALEAELRVTLSLLFYSAQMESLQFKMVVELVDQHEVGLGYLHKQLDVSGCLPLERQRDILVKYPLEDARLANQLKLYQDYLESQLISNLFNKLGLVPLQVAHVTTTFDFFSMQVRMTLLDLPLSQTFQVQRGLKIAVDNTGSRQNMTVSWALVRATSSSADKCADKCTHYNCIRFSYEPKLRECSIQTQSQGTRLVEHPTSYLFSHVNRTHELLWEGPSERVHMDPRSVVAMFERMTLSEQPDEDSSAGLVLTPLTLKTSVKEPANESGSEAPGELAARRQLVLRPELVASDFESMNEFRRREASSGEENSSADLQVVEFQGKLASRLEYSILFEDRTFLDDLGELVAGVDSFEDCAAFCQERDCRSLSYCQLNEQCRVTQMHDSKLIARYSKPRGLATGCNIYSLDYLSKFEPFGRVGPPSVSTRTESREASSERDCASLCMDERSFACHGFFFCRSILIQGQGLLKTQLSKCYLVSMHINSFYGKDLLTEPANPGSPANQDAQEQCSFFSRSYLAHFDKFYGKSIDLDGRPAAPGIRKMVATGYDVEFCAKRCIDNSCLAFDICPALGSGHYQRQRCQFAMDAITRSQVRDQSNCTTFVLSDRSQFKSAKVTLVEGLTPNQRAAVEATSEAASFGQPTESPRQEYSSTNQPIDINQDLLDRLEPDDFTKYGQEGPCEPGGAGWLAELWRKLWSLALGVAGGALFVLVWNEAYARGWLDQLTSSLAQAAGRRP